MSNYIGNLQIFEYKTSEWAIFKGRLTQFLKVNTIKDEDKSALLITHLSDESYRLVVNLAYPKKIEALSYVELVELFDTHFKAKECSYADRARFYSATKSPGESLGDWVARLRALASFCDFGAALETNVTDRFILGLGSGPERDRLFEQKPSTMTVSKALALAEQAESARAAKTLTNVVVKEESIYRASFDGERGRKGGAGGAGGGSGSGLARQARSGMQCSVCGMKNHDEEKCRFKFYKCNMCGKKGHLKKVCEKNNSRVNNICEENVESGSGSSCCEECQNFNIRYVGQKPIELELTIGNKIVTMELDTGSGNCVISEEMYNNLFSNYKLSKCNLKMCLYNGHKISPVGYFVSNASFNNKNKEIKIYVVENGGPPLLGRDFMSTFNLVISTSDLHNVTFIGQDNELARLLEQFSDLWRDELGTFNKFKVKLQLKENATPKFFKPRPIPFALKDKVEKELERLVSLGILVPVNYSQYATPIVPVLKENDKVRIAGDFSVTLNIDLVVDKYPLPRIEEVFAKLGGGEQYSKLDLKNAYNQFVLDDDCQELTTINTPKGLFKYTRLVYGLANAPAIFQKSMEVLLSGIEGVSCWLDDICVTGPNKEIHLQRLREIFRRLSEAGLRLQQEKCEFLKNSVTYLGYVINKKGLQTSPEKVRAILEAPEPSNVSEVKRFLGVVNYYRSFIPNTSSLLSPLHELTRASVEWQWGERQREALQRVRRELASERVLAHFEPTAQLVLTTDAGPGGLGAVLSQRDAQGRERPLAYASRSLTANERNYSQLQKEATAIIFGVKRFHQYIYGRSEPFILKTDHRPLISIFDPKTGISITTALRLQRYKIILAAYNYIVEFTSGVNNSVADFFSRAPLSDTSCNTDNESDAFTLVNFLNAVSPAVTANDIKSSSESDQTLITVKKYMEIGWPRKVTCKAMLPYFLCRADLQWENGCLLRGHKVIIPMDLREKMLKELHSTHLGVIKMKSNARSRMWWPGIDADIEQWIGGCNTCVSLRAAPPREPPAPWPRASAPWERVHIDFMTIGQRVYLVIVDAFSKWLECIYMCNGTNAKALISKLKIIFANFGLPKVLVSDNDVKINCQEFQEFCSSNGIKYMNSPIYHPCSNGQAENSVRVCKKMIKCIIKENLSPNVIHEMLLEYLFEYRNTIHCTTGETPAKLMLGRNLRSRLDLILPINKNIYKNEKCIEKKSAPLVSRRLFEIGDIVYVRWYSARKETWQLGKVESIIGKRMYKIFVFGFHSSCIRHIDQLIAYKGGSSSPYLTGPSTSTADSHTVTSDSDELLTNNRPPSEQIRSCPEVIVDNNSAFSPLLPDAQTDDCSEEVFEDCREECERGTRGDITASIVTPPTPTPGTGSAPAAAADGAGGDLTRDVSAQPPPTTPPLTRQLRSRKVVSYKKYF